MSYVAKTLSTHERILYTAHFHWTYTVGALLALIFLGIFLVGIWMFFHMMVRKFTTEIIVTSERFVFKTGWIARQTAEVNLRNIEEVNLHQTVLGRIMGYGRVTVRGTGTGLITLPDIDAPIKLTQSILEARDASKFGGFDKNGNPVK